MKFTSTLFAGVAGLVHLAAAQAVVGSAEGFAAGVTGGGDATPEYPSDIDELTTMLTDETPRVIVLNKEFDFTESEGTTSGNVCASWGTGDACQQIIQDDCGSSTALTGTWYNAPKTPIDIASNKTLLGVGSEGAIKGKGLRVRDGSSNIIIQNIQVSDLNHKYVWGGDAISFDGADLVWVDHVTTARPGRQHYCFGYGTSTRITLSNNFVNGDSTYSTGCNGYHYWVFEMVGEADQITMKNNYIYHTAGRGPALSGGTLLHAVNNVWEDINGHAIEGGEVAAKGVFEGNVFIDVDTLISDYQGTLFSSPDATTNAGCQDAFGRSCEVNVFENTDSSSFESSDTSFFSDFSGLTIASADSASDAKSSVPQNAGAGIIDVSSGGSSSSGATTPSSDATPAASSVSQSSTPQPTEFTTAIVTPEAVAESTSIIPASSATPLASESTVPRVGKCGASRVSKRS